MGIILEIDRLTSEFYFYLQGTKTITKKQKNNANIIAIILTALIDKG